MEDPNIDLPAPIPLGGVSFKTNFIISIIGGVLFLFIHEMIGLDYWRNRHSNTLWHRFLNKVLPGSGTAPKRNLLLFIHTIVFVVMMLWFTTITSYVLN